MHNKNLILIAALSTILPGVARADDNSLTVNGTVYTAACTIVASYVNATWAIGDVSLTSLPAAGDVLKGPTNFAALNLLSCPAALTINYNFAGEPDADMPELFKVADGVGQATGVAFKLEIGSAATTYEQLLPKTNSANYTISQNGSVYALAGMTLRGSLVATGGKTNFTGATGTLNTTMTYSVIYN